MESGISSADRTQGLARATIDPEPAPTLARVVAVVACVASSAVWLWFTSPQPNYFWNLAVPALAFGGAIATLLLVFFVGGLAGLFKLPVPYLTVPVETHHGRTRLRHRKYYLFALLFAVAALASIAFHLPLNVRFALSRPAMDAFIAEVLANPNAARPEAMRVGWYVIETTPDRQQRSDGALMFHLRGDSEAGFTYSARPIGYPGASRGDGHSLGGGWYWFSDE